MADLQLSEIWIYPVKSLGGIALEKATVLGKGLQYDRRWMLIDSSGVAMTQRVYPEMALFKPAISESALIITYSHHQKTAASIVISTEVPADAHWIFANIWGDTVNVLEVSPHISEWFSDHLKTACKFVVFPEEQARPVDRDYSIRGEHVSLADAYPFLLISQSSLDDLNSRLAQPVPMNRFRPNFVVTGGDPYQEDQWKNLSIGTVSFAGVKKSSRCVLITVNQDNGEKGPEPLRTLSAYRKEGTNVYFGQNLVALEAGQVKVGDPVIPS